MITPHENKHETEDVFCPWRNTPIPIDRELAPLIEMLWRLGIETEQCCQEYCPGNSFISFADCKGASRFWTIANRKYMPAATLSTDLQPGYQIWLSVLFPKADIPYLVERFCEATRVHNSVR